ncbi:MAG: antitoxin [Ornithinimicrobium sp.]
MDKAKDAAGDHSDQVNSGIDKGSDYADEKTGGKHTEHIDKAGDTAREQVDGFSGEADEAKNAKGQNTE